jgi:hypothetical protein
MNINQQSTYYNFSYIDSITNKTSSITDNTVTRDDSKKSNTNHSLKPRKIVAQKKEDAFFYLSVDDFADTAKATAMMAKPEIFNVIATYQPSMQDSVAKEGAIFREMMRPFLDLPEEQRQKAVILLIQDRLAQKATYGHDIDTEGVGEFYSNVEHILADKAQGIDCEDYSELAQFYLEIAQEEKVIPQEANFYQLYIPEHQLLIYELPATEGKQAQHYVIDNITIALTSKIQNSNKKINLELINFISPDYIRKFDKNNDDLVTLTEYIGKKSINNWLADGDYGRIANKSSLITQSGGRVYGKKFITPEWIKTVTGNNDIANSISKQKVVKIQRQYLVKYGEPKLQKDFNETEFTHYINAIRKKNMFGFYKSISKNNKGKPEDLKITPEEAVYIIGSYSKGLEKKLDISDMKLNDQQKMQLLGRYSPVLKRKFTTEDLKLDKNIISTTKGIDNNISQIYATEDKNSSSIEEKIKYTMNIDDNLDVSIFFNVLGMLGTISVLFSINQSRHMKVRNRKKIFFDPKNKIEYFNRAKKNKFRKEKRHDWISLIDFSLLKKLSALISSIHNFDEYPNDYVELNLTNEELQHTYSIIKLLNIESKNISLNQLKECYQCLLNLHYKAKLAVHKDDKHRKELQNLAAFLDKLDQESLYTTSAIQKISSVLEYYGIKFSYSSDKIFGKYRNSSKVTKITIKLDLTKLYNFLKRNGILPYIRTLDYLWTKNFIFLNRLYKLKDLDKRKIRYHKIDHRLKVLAFTSTIIPVIPTNDLVKILIYKRGINYRKKNQKIISYRIEKALKSLDDNILPADKTTHLYNSLNNIKQIKQKHLNIKINQNKTNCMIHGISSGISISSLALGPIALLAKTGFKITTKLSNSIAGAAIRHKVDKEHIDNNNFETTKNIYLYLKQLHQQATNNDNKEAVDFIANFAEMIFGIPRESYAFIISTNLVEDDKYKVSLSQKITEDNT